ncbi:hypothetical protein L210DRAFT_928319 [Boletus edulis BED1]|uniref:Homeobox domain-containing protein n=1 Tax=Boletus edulis BED1 TaxID=1328754 RepID=A0AAD4C154_BOLED|nr:hypothetical protein L210DRAFT_928319 [Boletus edulis BED1]
MGHKSEDRPSAPILRDILRIVLELKEVTAFSHSLSHSSVSTGDSSVVVDSINLPSPRPLLPSLLEAGIDHGIAAEINKTYQHRAEELRSRIQESVATTCRGIAELPAVTLASSPDPLIRRVVFAFTELYLRRLEQWKDEIIQRIKQASTKSSNDMIAPRNTRTFNYKYVPLLEHFFEENPFPTHADKMFLAKKSNMDYRQIHVWFQNRRNRTKKEGKTLRKKTAHEGATKPLVKLYQRMTGHMVDSDSQLPRSSKVDLSKGTTEVNMSKDAFFASSSPPHTFPSPYPPSCNYDPFPCKGGPVHFSMPEWRRVPDGKRLHSISIPIDDLVEKFSHLSVRDGAYPNGSPRLLSHAATVAITVIPSRAPHPSLIVRKYTQPTNLVQLRPSVRAPDWYSKAFQSPSLTSKSVTLVPLSAPNKSKLPGKWKIASLPQRFPGRIRDNPRDAIPSESSSTSSSSPVPYGL